MFYFLIELQLLSASIIEISHSSSKIYKIISNNRSYIWMDFDETVTLMASSHEDPPITT
jgi:hypothetical protein